MKIAKSLLGAALVFSAASSLAIDGTTSASLSTLQNIRNFAGTYFFNIGGEDVASLGLARDGNSSNYKLTFADLSAKYDFSTLTLAGQSFSTASLNGMSNTSPWSALSNTSVATVSYSLAPVPEPESYAMLLAGLGVMGFVARRRQKRG
ncbi:PEP-CTERM sorting domain-containing protein [Azonexus sp.]|uniref:PEP-CTERM sorting domain-containing protein n=1 Tax=Azonexus sp. TaxID=1872668 RepID=UPI0035AF365C